MQFQFDEKIDAAIQKSLKSALRQLKEQAKIAKERGNPLRPPTFEEFMIVVEGNMESNKAVELDRLRTPSLRDLFDRAWAQKLRNYATQRQFRDAYEALVRRF